MSQRILPEIRFCGKVLSEGEVDLINGVLRTCRGLSRSELANTICELLGWERANGRLKKRECLELIDLLEADGLASPPAYRNRRRFGPLPPADDGVSKPPPPLQARSVGEVAPVVLERVVNGDQRKQWKQLVSRHHYLGYKVAFGAHLRYLIKVSRPQPRVVGCLQFSSPAWRIKARDGWIGWDDTTRANNLQRIVNNSRFLILPYVNVPNLASHALSLATKQIAGDWFELYRIRPVLLETLVDPAHFNGGCYKAANWLEIGQTSGRGRQDHKHERHGVAPKTLFVYPLAAKSLKALRQEGE